MICEKPLAIDLFCGLGGWTEGLLEEGYDVIGFDNVRHVYGDHRYPAQLVVQDVTTLHGSQLKNAAVIVASPPCQKYSYMAMPWKRAKAQAAAIRADTTGAELEKLNRLFDACFRIQREASEAAGHLIPIIVENVKGAQPWVGRARWSFGSFYLWGDVPALMPIAFKAQKLTSFRFDGSGRSFQTASVEETGRKSQGMNWSDQSKRGQDFTRVAGDQAIKNSGGSWFNIAHNTASGTGNNPDGRKGVGPMWDPTTQSGSYGMKRWTNPAEGVKQSGSGAAWWDKALDERRKEATAIKNGGDWFASGDDCSPQRRASSGSTSRKFASAMIAKIPLPLSRHIGATFYPTIAVEAAQ